MHFSEIIKFQFEKERHTSLYILKFFTNKESSLLTIVNKNCIINTQNNILNKNSYQKESCIIIHRHLHRTLSDLSHHLFSKFLCWKLKMASFWKCNNCGLSNAVERIECQACFEPNPNPSLPFTVRYKYLVYGYIRNIEKTIELFMNIAERLKRMLF